MKYIFLSNLPGGAYFAFMKFVALNNNVGIRRGSGRVYSFPLIPDLTPEERLEKLFPSFIYNKNWKSIGLRWIQLESQGFSYTDSKEDIMNSLTHLIWTQNHSFNDEAIVPNSTDQYFYVQLSYSKPEILDWIQINAKEKHSFITDRHLNQYQRDGKHKNIYKFDIENLLQGFEKFIESFNDFCDYVKIDKSNRSHDVLKEAYQRWRSTTFDNKYTRQLRRENND